MARLAESSLSVVSITFLVMNLYRLPLNFVVAGGTRLGSVGGWQAVVLMNSLTLPLALALQTVAATERKDRRD